MTSPLPTLETGRLILRPFTLADAPAVQALAGAAEVARTTLNIPHPYPDGAAEAWIGSHADNAAAGRSYVWAVVRRAGGVLMGSISLGVEARHRRAEMGYWLGLPYWNQGYMTEAARRILAFGFDELGLQRIQATCFPHNVASARVMEKAGLIYEGLLRRYVLKGDQFEDVLIYARLRAMPDDRAG